MAENGYRYYNQENLARLQEILLFRGMDFPLKDIHTLRKPKSDVVDLI
ncbi:MerR family transcriptional regulator [Streptococcus suis]|nr:MerR family transcriptional regulator [Streptococcus suis]NQN60150.1 MerR family transcriptional regulator [Streptococcus suis]NQP75666.1 MerR family transcriptional regulator [Streptococcus suis]NQP77694.1 MerR family transcriptional regulator [Streptococcus suis]NQP90866.1 MerR family transcriptional regulator [Streptococcus suis]